jgi:hypothetical protein
LCNQHSLQSTVFCCAVPNVLGTGYGVLTNHNPK